VIIKRLSMMPSIQDVHREDRMKTAKVYEDPLTRQNLEGTATVIAEWGEPDIDGLKKCTVRFHNLGEPMVVRYIHIDDLREEQNDG